MTGATTTEIRKTLGKKASSDLKDFVDTFYANVPAEDMRLLDSKTAAGIAQLHWDLSKKRKKGQPAIRISTLQQGETLHTAIDIVQDDMAFLIDSVVAEIVRHNQLIHFLIHPILHVRRSGAGIVSIDAKPGEGAVGQSHSHIQLSGTITNIQSEELEMGLKQVLADVEHATQSWPEMREKLREAQRELSNAPAKYNDSLIEEYQAFLEYLYNNNFTILGVRQYKFTDQNGTIGSETLKGKSLGLLRDDHMPVYINEVRNGLTPLQQKLRRNQPPMTISKVNRRSTVHRRVPLDAIAVKTFDKNGNVSGEILFVGLFTSVTYSRSVGDIPLVRRKVQNILDRTNFLPGSHDRKALRNILERYPRDETLQIDEDVLYRHALSILRLQERPRIALYVRPDPFGRYISALVYVPRERYGTRLRLKFQHILEEEMNGVCSSFNVTQDDSPLARIIFMIDINRLPHPPKFNVEAIEQKLQDAGRLWAEHLRDALNAAHHDDQVVARLTAQFGQAFPLNYHDRYSARQAVFDIHKIEEMLAGKPIALDLYRTHDGGDDALRLKIFIKDNPIPLSDILPMLENMGLRVLSEYPFEVQPAKLRGKIWIHDLQMTVDHAGRAAKLEDIKPLFEEAFTRIWLGEVESDALNRLVISAQMPWLEVRVLRAYTRYMQQTQISFSRPYMEQALTANPGICRLILKLFKVLLDPVKSGTGAAQSAEIVQALEKVESLDHDRILRTIVSLVETTLRTNYFQTSPEGGAKSYISFKFDSAKVPNIPDPRPFREIFIYSPRVEGIHLRADRIARGGIRWSDRHEDFRTEVLGLMKAQNVKNALIVPMGAKGGFVVKRPPKEGGRPAYLQEGIECYKIFIRGLLDITDNLKGEKILPPPNVARRDGDDPYLVVAADKGTATFSDIANSLSLEYKFWLGDAFASGGSAGYDHKKMGITARGGWESVKRHFRELNHDTQTQPFDVVGVGDMAGDVFGNAMLLSEKIRLIGTFNHIHIFCDPNPDPATTFKERKRLFEAVKGWDEYDQKKLSPGGRIYLRTEKSLSLTPEIRKRFDIQAEKVTPSELIQAMLRARTDLLWFGGIGTYVKASRETHQQVGDRTNDSLRINARELRAKVLGEGANLAMTQAARIEFAENGGRLNADFIDNSAGVDSSDHEVNIKILLADVMNQPGHKMDTAARNKLLASMTDEVSAHVLRHNYQQAQAISLMELQAAEDLPMHAKFISDMEREMSFNRALEGLPEEDVIQTRLRQGRGLTRPELSILQAYAKIMLTRELLKSDILEAKPLERRLVVYFPDILQKKFRPEILRHKLHREIAATSMANGIVNRMGPTFVKSNMNRTGASSAEVVKGYIIARDVFRLRPMWDEIESLYGKIPAQVQLRAMREISHLGERAVTWFLTRLGHDLSIDGDIETFRPGIDQLKKILDDVVTPDLSVTIEQVTSRGISDGLSETLAHDIAQMPVLASACDIIRISRERKTDMALTAKTYFELGEYFHLDWLRHKAQYLPAADRWSGTALEGLIEQLYICQAGITVRILKDMGINGKNKKVGRDSVVRAWIKTHGHQAELLEPLLADMRRASSVDLPMLVIAAQRLGNLCAS